jgi:hypothetical protein
MTHPSEKRSSRRVESDIRIHSLNAPEVIEMEAVNVSMGGAYCTTRQHFEPMTKLEVHLDLPGHTHLSETITASAVVVRVEDAVDDAPYRLALLFQGMGEDDRARLQRYRGQDGN